MRTKQQWFDQYAVSHQNYTNQIIHYFCVPAIFFSIIGMLMSINATLLQNIFKLENPLVENWSIVVIFVIAWIGQFYGHYIEGKKPSFLKDLQFLLISPTWVFEKFFK